MKLFRTPLLALVASIGACAPVEAPPAPAAVAERLNIYLLPDGNCEIQDKKLPCPEVPRYMLDVLNLNLAVSFSVVARGKPTYESTAALFQALRDAGFKYKMGYVNVRD